LAAGPPAIHLQECPSTDSQALDDLSPRQARLPQGYQLQEVDLLLCPSFGVFQPHRRRGKFGCTGTAPTIQKQPERESVLAVFVWWHFLVCDSPPASRVPHSKNRMPEGAGSPCPAGRSPRSRAAPEAGSRHEAGGPRRRDRFLLGPPFYLLAKQNIPIKSDPRTPPANADGNRKNLG